MPTRRFDSTELKRYPNRNYNKLQSSTHRWSSATITKWNWKVQLTADQVSQWQMHSSTHCWSSLTRTIIAEFNSCWHKFNSCWSSFVVRCQVLIIYGPQTLQNKTPLFCGAIFSISPYSLRLAPSPSDPGSCVIPNSCTYNVNLRYIKNHFIFYEIL